MHDKCDNETGTMQRGQAGIIETRRGHVIPLSNDLTTTYCMHLLPLFTDTRPIFCTVFVIQFPEVAVQPEMQHASCLRACCSSSQAKI